MAVTPNSIVTPQAPQSNNAPCTTANTTYTTTPTNSVLLVTAGANGARVTRIGAIPIANVAATQCQLFRSRDAGTTKYFFDSAAMASYTFATGTEAPTTDFGYSDDNPIFLAANERIYAAIAVTNAITFGAEWADY